MWLGGMICESVAEKLSDCVDGEFVGELVGVRELVDFFHGALQ